MKELEDLKISFQKCRRALNRCIAAVDSLNAKLDHSIYMMRLHHRFRVDVMVGFGFPLVYLVGLAIYLGRL